MPQESANILERTRAELHAHTSGELRFDEHLRPLRVILSPDGQLVAPVMVAMIESADTVLFLPAADEDALQMQVTLEPFEESGNRGWLTDRWRAYHGEPEDVRWALLHIDAARFGGAIIDGEALMVPNPLVELENALCREVNQSQREALQAMVKRELDLDFESPTLVGISPFGLNVRGPFDVVHVSFPRRARDEADARALINALLST